MHGQQHMKLVFALLLLCLTTSCLAFEWKECPDEKSDLQTLTDVTLKPEPVPAGSTAKFEIRGISKVDTTTETLKLTVYYLGVPVYRSKIGDPSKIGKGAFTVAFARNFPSYTPPGSYKVKVESISKEGKLLICLDVKFKVTWASWQRTSSHIPPSM